MFKIKTETLNLRVEPRIKDALRAAAEQEHRSLANMIEVMVIDFCARQGISIPERPARDSGPEINR